MPGSAESHWEGEAKGGQREGFHTCLSPSPSCLSPSSPSPPPPLPLLLLRGRCGFFFEHGLYFIIIKYLFYLLLAVSGPNCGPQAVFCGTGLSLVGVGGLGGGGPVGLVAPRHEGS